MRKSEIDGVAVAVETINAHNQSYRKINAKVCRPARAHKRKRDADTRQKHKAHTEIDNSLRTNHKSRAVANQTAGKVS